MTRIRKLPVEAWDGAFVQELKASGAFASFVAYPASSVMAHAPHMTRANAAFHAEANGGRTLLAV